MSATIHVHRGFHLEMTLIRRMVLHHVSFPYIRVLHQTICRIQRRQ